MSLWNLGVDAVTSSTGTWTPTGGTNPAVLTDGSDATTLKRTSSGSGTIICSVANQTVPSNEVASQFRWRCRQARSSGTTATINTSPLNGSANWSGSLSLQTLLGGWVTPSAGGTISQSVIDSLAISIQDTTSGSPSTLTLYELGIDLQTASVPVAPTVSSPPASTDSTRPLVAWAHSDRTAFTATSRGAGATVGGGGAASTTRYLTIGTHSLQIGNDVAVTIGNANYDGTWKITAVTATTIQYTATGIGTLSEAATAISVANGVAYGDSGAQTGYEVRLFTSAQYGIGGFDPATSPATWESGWIAGTGSSTTPTTTLAAGTYRAYVQTAKAVNGVDVASAWGYAQFVVVSSTPGASLTATLDTPNSRTTLVLQGGGNLLSAQDAQLETAATTGTWATNANCTVTQSGTLFDVGAGSLRLSSTGAGTMSARTASGTGGIAVLGSTAYSATMRLRSGASARTCSIGIIWYDSAGGTISTSTGSTATSSTAAFTTYTVTATSPSNAAYAAVIATVQSTGGASELHYVDTVALHPGSTPAYSPGGMTWTAVLTRTPTGGTATDVRPPLTLDVSQRLTTYDYEAPRGIQSTYSFTLVGSAASGGVASAAATQNVTPTNDGTYWLKAMASPSLNRGSVRILADPQEEIEENLGEFRLDGRSDVVVVSGQIFGQDPAFEIRTSGAAEYEAILALVRHQGTLLLQEPYTDSAGTGLQRYIRLTSRRLARSGTSAAPRAVFQLGAVEVGRGY